MQLVDQLQLAVVGRVVGGADAQGVQGQIPLVVAGALLGELVAERGVDIDELVAAAARSGLDVADDRLDRLRDVGGVGGALERADGRPLAVEILDGDRAAEAIDLAARALPPELAVKAAADTMRANPAIGDMATAITELAVGEALISFLDAKGRPSVTERVFVLPPGSQIGPISADQRKALIDTSLVAGVYEKTVDRESAYEKLKGRTAGTAGAAPAGDAAGRVADEASTATQARTPVGTASVPPAAPSGGGLMGELKDVLFGSTGPRGGRHEGLAESAARSAMRSIGSSVGREIIRGVLGSILGGKR